jgi:hypothetical protein
VAPPPRHGLEKRQCHGAANSIQPLAAVATEVHRLGRRILVGEGLAERPDIGQAKQVSRRSTLEDDEALRLIIEGESWPGYVGGEPMLRPVMSVEVV